MRAALPATLAALPSFVPGAEPRPLAPLPGHATCAFAKERAAADWSMKLAPDFDQVRFLRTDLVVVRQSFSRRACLASASPADRPSSLLEATAFTRGESWTLLGWYAIAGPISPQRHLAPGIPEPRKLKHVDPVYPEFAVGSRVAARLILEAEVDVQGHVRSVNILRGMPLFDEEAVKAVRQWEYAPTPEGAPIPLTVIATLDFTPGSRRASVQEQFRLEQPSASRSSPGIPAGADRDLGGLYFDPEGADFTLWIQRFKDEVHRNWIAPQAFLRGDRGHVDFEFKVERNGTGSALRMLKSSGTASLDRAAQNA